jgi:Fur family transcriptional regulator, ferric uptake regulator
MEHCDSRELLRSRSIRATLKKVAILGEIVESARPLSAAELYARIVSRVPLDLATVYRTLNLLRESRLVREITDATGTQYYEIACMHNPVHPHFKCVCCRSISCLPSLGSGDAAYMSRFAGDCEIQDISITLSGICGKCREEKA